MDAKTENKPEVVKAIDVASRNIAELSEFITASLAVSNKLKIELGEGHRINLLEAIASSLIHTVNPLIQAVVELEAELDSMKQRIVDLEADAEQGLLTDHAMGIEEVLDSLQPKPPAPSIKSV